MPDSRCGRWAQNLILPLETGGEAKAAELLRRAGALGETAKKALADNAPVVARPEIPGLAAGQSTPRSAQVRMP